MIALGIIDRAGDRKPLSDWVKKRMKAQGDYKIIDSSVLPPSKGTDIVKRVKWIQEQAKDCEFLYLFENDDYYELDYIKKMEEARGDADFINSYIYVRYQINRRYYQLIGHISGGNYVGGLWTMGFRPDILGDYFWQRMSDTDRNLDSCISKYVQWEKDIKDVWFNNHGGVGIKGHGYGKFKPTGPHDRFNPPYITDNDAMVLSILTDESFVDLHYPGEYKEYTMNKDQLMGNIKNTFQLDSQFLEYVKAQG